MPVSKQSTSSMRVHVDTRPMTINDEEIIVKGTNVLLMRDCRWRKPELLLSLARGLWQGSSHRGLEPGVVSVSLPLTIFVRLMPPGMDYWRGSSRAPRACI